MNAYLPFGDIAWWSVAGWTMLHFLWLGTLLGLGALVCRLVVRRASAPMRYGVALVNLAVLAALPLGIGACSSPRHMSTVLSSERWRTTTESSN
jgi:hypothetical protein